MNGLIRLGLTTNAVVAVGTFDAHAGAVGAGVEEYSLVRVMGTSTCDIMVAPNAVIGDILASEVFAVRSMALLFLVWLDWKPGNLPLGMC